MSRFFILARGRYRFDSTALEAYYEPGDAWSFIANRATKFRRREYAERIAVDLAVKDPSLIGKLEVVRAPRSLLKKRRKDRPIFDLSRRYWKRIRPMLVMNRKHPCPHCRHPEFRVSEAEGSKRPKFTCTFCDEWWTCGKDGGDYMKHAKPCKRQY